VARPAVRPSRPSFPVNAAPAQRVRRKGSRAPNQHPSASDSVRTETPLVTLSKNYNLFLLLLLRPLFLQHTILIFPKQYTQPHVIFQPFGYRATFLYPAPKQHKPGTPRRNPPQSSSYCPWQISNLVAISSRSPLPTPSNSLASTVLVRANLRRRLEVTVKGKTLCTFLEVRVWALRESSVVSKSLRTPPRHETRHAQLCEHWQEDIRASSVRQAHGFTITRRSLPLGSLRSQRRDELSLTSW
jgi:hypothetical protein